MYLTFYSEDREQELRISHIDENVEMVVINKNNLN
jgi:hypothetical protein